MSVCRKCGAEIMFIKTKTGGKPMPCDTERKFYRPGGADRLMTPEGSTIACTIIDDRAEAEGYGYTSHFATCPYAEEFRKGRK